MTTVESGEDKPVNRRWYVVYSRPRQEEVAATHLVRQGFETYLPRITTQRRQRGQFQSIITAYFPRYLFVRFDIRRDHWAPIRSTRGVSALVKIQGTPRPVPEELISQLRTNEDAQQIQRLKLPDWRPGAEVEIELGPFAGYRGLFQAHRGADRVAVLLELLGRSALVTLDSQALQAPEPA